MVVSSPLATLGALLAEHRLYGRLPTAEPTFARGPRPRFAWSLCRGFAWSRSHLPQTCACLSPGVSFAGWSRQIRESPPSTSAPSHRTRALRGALVATPNRVRQGAD